jgi:hypothetical protein
MEQKLEKLKQENNELKRIVRFLSNQEAVKGLKSALQDFKEGRYTILTK